MEVEFRPTIKQYEALRYLYDDHTEELLFGGGAGGGKSVIGCFWLISNCLKYPEVRYLLGRAVLKNLKATTVKTLFRLMGNTHSIHNEVRFNLKKDRDYKYNKIDGEIIFSNGSEIVLKDLKLEPSDTEFDTLGSLEITGAFIDEVSEIPHKAKEVILSRCRHLTQEYGLIAKVLYCTNPSKNWSYLEFYRPWRDNKLIETRIFIQALVTDNPYSDPNYIKTLKRRDEKTRERLLNGNWEYDDDPSVLCDYDKILDMFTNDFVPEGDMYISSDLAMKGRDLFIILTWSGLRCKVSMVKALSNGKDIEMSLKRTAKNEKVPRSNVVADSDGMGNYLESYMEGIREFKGGNSAKNPEVYANMRSECFFKLAEYINKGKIYIDCEDSEIKERIIAECEQIKAVDVHNDEKKKRIIPKESKPGSSCQSMKGNLGGSSPDYIDCLMMRMLFEINPQRIGFLSDPDNILGLG